MAVTLDALREQPSPRGGWSESISVLDTATVVPPKVSDMVQEAGVLRSDGSYCAEAALWRRWRPITIEPPMPKGELAQLNGRWLWGGVLWAHFGHFLVESSSRLWALSQIDEAIDGILFIPKRPTVGDQIRGFQQEFVDLFGRSLPIKVAADPVTVEQLIVPGQGFGLGPIIEATSSYRNAIHAEFARSVRPKGAEKIYVSRSKLGLRKGGLLGEELLENLLQEEGYTVFHPQEHSLTDQLAQYKAARQIIAADGSAVHLYAMVGRPDQEIAIVLRRLSAANTMLTDNVRCFCKSDPCSIGALRTEWVPVDQQKSSRRSFGELDHRAIGIALKRGGFISGDADWPTLGEAERAQVLADKGIEIDRFVESPDFVRQRQRKARQERRALREARLKDQS